MAATVQIVQLSGAAVAGGVSGTATAPATSFENKNSGTLRFQTVDTLDETSFANAILSAYRRRRYSKLLNARGLSHVRSKWNV